MRLHRAMGDIAPALRGGTMSMLLALMLTTSAACSGDDDDNAEPCPDGAEAGDLVPCTCDDDESGVQRCRTDDTLGTCDCSGGSDSGSGGSAGRSGSGSGSSGSGGSAGRSGSGGSGSGGSGGTAGSPVEEDAGMTMEDDAGVLPMDGEQLSVCQSTADCDGDLECYNDGPGQGFCTITCSGDPECEAVAGAAYTCSVDDQCEIICEGTDDTTTCPDGMDCVRIGGGPNQRFSCKYPEAP